MSGYD